MTQIAKKLKTMSANNALFAFLKVKMEFVNRLIHLVDYITQITDNVLAAMMASNYKIKNVRLIQKMYLILIVLNGRMESVQNALSDHFSPKQESVSLLIHYV